ncbi:MAG: alpha/beta hydrolase family protein [Geminicoccaceae bacterium]
MICGWASIAGIVLTATLCGACSPSRSLEAARLGLDVASGVGGRTTAAPAGQRHPVVLAGQSGDLYYPEAPPLAALLLIPGVTPAGRDDARLVALAEALARHGFLIFVPDLAGLRAQRVGPDDPASVTLAADALATCFAPGVDPRFGLVAISYAVAPAILAALEPAHGGHIGLVVGVGGYHSAVAAITYLTTGYYRPAPGTPWRMGSPERIAKWLFLLASASRVPAPADRDRLTAIAQARIEDAAADVAGLEAGLGASGRPLMVLIDNRDPDRVPELIAGLPSALRGDIEYLDLSRYNLKDLQASLLLIHGHDDPLIPPSESVALAEAAPAGQAEVFIVSNLSHVEIHPGGIADTLALWRAAYRLLSFREDLTPPRLRSCAVDDGMGRSSETGGLRLGRLLR